MCCGSWEELGPRGGTPGVTFLFVQMRGDKRRFLVANAEILESWGARADVVDYPKALRDQRLNHRGTPAS